MTAIISREAKEIKIKQIQNKQVQNQIHIFNALESEIQAAKFSLKQGINYAEYTRELDAVIKLRQSAMIGMHHVNPNYLTLRNLATTSILLTEISRRTDSQLKSVKSNIKVISEAQRDIDSLTARPELYMIPEDLSSKTIYYDRFITMKKDAGDISIRLKNALDSIQRIEFRSNNLKYALQTDIAEIRKMQKVKQKYLLSGGDESISDKNTEESSSAGLIYYSLSKGLLVVTFYLFNHWVDFWIMLLLIIAISAYLNVLKRNFRRAGIYEQLNRRAVIFEHPIATPIVIIITVYQFFLTLPPIILTAILWTIAGFSLTIILKSLVNKFQFRIWIIFYLLGIFAHLNNLNLVHSIAESWFMMALSAVTIIVGGTVILKRKEFGNKPKMIIVTAVVIFELLSILMLITGNYNTAKIYLTTGIYTALIGYLLIHSYKLLKDILRFSEYLRESDEVRDPEELIGVQNKITVGNYIFFIIGWYILNSRNSVFFQQFTEPLKEMISKPREIGAFSFSIQGIFIFLLILIVSSVMVRIISLLSATDGTLRSGSNKTGMGSWLLLVRIGVITVGILVAFVSAGIPVDRIVVIISALGVGIGFGMQTLVNNVISGIIIAFEKPVKLNDIVEIGNQTGKMKSIGIRSSVVTTYDGSDLIIPNGDLLDKHLVNWTKGSNRRRFDISVGVEYKTDLLKAKMLILEVLDKNTRVLKYPEPVIWVTAFSSSSIDLSIKFWVAHFNFGFDVKSELMIEIDKVLRENKIIIPFPQHDIHIIQGPDKKLKPN